jgi:hypothetical protein
MDQAQLTSKPMKNGCCLPSQHWFFGHGGEQNRTINRNDVKNKPAMLNPYRFEAQMDNGHCNILWGAHAPGRNVPEKEKSSR